MPKRARKDLNQDEIVAALEAVGAEVWIIEEPVDLMVGFRGINYLLEVKGLTGTLTDRQKVFFRDWRGHKAVVRSVDEALRAIGAIE